MCGLLILSEWWANRWATQEGGGACCFAPDGGGYDRRTREGYAGSSVLPSVSLPRHFGCFLRCVGHSFFEVELHDNMF
jgi:hypothetical protein